MCNVDHAPASASCPLRRVGTTVASRYKLERMLGCGGMGAVYEAENLALGRKVAIKMLHPRFAAMADIVARFRREARSVAGLNHLGFPSVHALETTPDGDLVIEMELLRGMPVDGIVARGQIAIERAVEILESALEALAVAHDAGLVHRDLKPENLFWCEAPHGHVKILDFGIARANDGQELTSAGQMFGTLSYASPEQLKDAGRADTRSDVYSLGATAFEIVTGQTPAGRGTMPEVMSRILEDKIEHHAVKLRADLPDWLDAWIARALDADPAKRFANAREMRAGLKRSAVTASTDAPSAAPASAMSATLPATPASAAPASAASTSAASTSAAPASAAAASAAPASTPPPSGTSPGTPVTPPVSDAPMPAPSGRTPRSRGLALAIGGTVIVAGAIVVFVAMRGSSSEPSPPVVAPSTPRTDAAIVTPDVAVIAATTSDPVESRPAPPSLFVDLTVWSPSRSDERALAPGATLHAGDKIAFQVSTSGPAYVYMLQKIGDDLDVMFPGRGVAVGNPVPGKRPMRIPAKSWFTLVDDGLYGTTTITVIASPTRIADLESILQTMTAQRGDVQRTAVKSARVAIQKLADPGAPRGEISRGHLELLDETQRQTVSVRYRQRPEDSLVVAAFDFVMAK